MALIQLLIGKLIAQLKHILDIQQCSIINFSSFNRLREVVPKLDADYKLSKFETLQMALNYIGAMCELLDKGTVESSFEFFGASENNNCSKILNKN